MIKDTLSPPLPAGLPHIACILLWYPLFTQPFIFREIENLKHCLPLTVYALYDKNLRHCSKEMHAATDTTRTFGIKALPTLLLETLRFFLTHPLRLCRLYRRTLGRRWNSLEVFAENLWAFVVGIRLGRLLREDGIDMVYAPWPRGTATAAWTAATLAGIPFTTSARGDNLEPADPDLSDKLTAALFVRANNAADKKRIECFDKGQAKGKTALVYNSLTLPAQISETDVPALAPARNPAQNPEGSVRLLSIGRFDVTKGFDVLIRACALLRDRGIDFTLTLAGGGSVRMGIGNMTDTLKNLRAELRLTNHIHMPGMLSHDELPDTLRAHDIFVAPCIIHASGRRDGIPNTVIEAMSYSMPIVSTTVNALPEVVRNGRTGLTVPPNDPEALAQAIDYLIRNPLDARRMGDNANALATKLFNSERNTKRLTNLFVTRYALWEKTCAE